MVTWIKMLVLLRTTSRVRLTSWCLSKGPSFLLNKLNSNPEEPFVRDWLAKLALSADLSFGLFTFIANQIQLQNDLHIQCTLPESITFFQIIGFSIINKFRGKSLDHCRRFIYCLKILYYCQQGLLLLWYNTLPSTEFICKFEINVNSFYC